MGALDVLIRTSPERLNDADYPELPSIRNCCCELFAHQSFDLATWDRLIEWLQDRHGKSRQELLGMKRADVLALLRAEIAARDGRKEVGGGGEGGTTPRQYLTNWREILVALGMKDNKEDKAKVRAIHKKDPDSPIIVTKQGAQPKVEKAKLLAWWNGLEEKYQEDQRRERDKKATVAATSFWP